MNHSRCILAIDQGTTGSRSILYDHRGRIVSSAYQEFPQIFPQPGWVEHDPEKIWASVRSTITSAFRQTKESAIEVSAIGITNQRETTVLWDKKSGQAVANAIVWQDRRTAAECQLLRERGYETIIRQKTGLVLDPYFSATKIAWLLRRTPGLMRRAKRGEILFGTIDSWILWKLTGGRVHATDFTNASRTLLFNIHTRRWDEKLLRLFSIPPKMLPEVRISGGFFGAAAVFPGLLKNAPICAVLGDQQAALYGQGCYNKGQVKNTYGTGCFVMSNCGSKRPSQLPQGLLLTLACNLEGNPVYALEGAVFIGGAVIQWLRDGLQLIRSGRDAEQRARSVKTTGGVTFVPAFAGLGSPYWNTQARGMISGLTRGTSRDHIIRAALESIAHQSADVIEAMREFTPIAQLKVDGGASQNALLMQFQADLLKMPVHVSSQTESTAWGAAKLAGYVSGFWKGLKSVDSKCRYRHFRPKLTAEEVLLHRKQWKKEIQRVCL